MTLAENEQVVIVVDLNKANVQKVFGGFPGLSERFAELDNSFTEDISFTDVVNYLTPSNGPITVINKEQ